MPKKVLVLGARGFLGEHIVAQLGAAGYEVVAMIRPKTAERLETAERSETAALFSAPWVRVLRGDCTDTPLVRQALEQVDAAVFCAGRTWQPGLDTSEYQRQNVAITESFLEALGHRPNLRVVFTSSLSTVGGSKTPRVYEEDSGRDGIRPQWLSPYDHAKIECERLALQSAARGNNLVSLNPGLLLGPGVSSDSNLAAPFCLLWFLQGQFVARFYVQGGVTLSDVRDVARAHVAALQHGQAGQRYILGGHHLDRREFYRRVMPLVGRRMPAAIPASFLYALTSAGDGIAWLTRGVLPSPVHRSFAYTQRLYYYGASDRAIAELGYKVTPIEQTIYEMMRHYQDRGLLPPASAIPAEIRLEELPAYVLLKQLVRRSGFARWLLSRLPEMYRASQANHALRESLGRLLQTGRFDPSRGVYRWSRGEAREDLQTIQKFIEYVHFSSNAFLRQSL